MNGKSRGKIPSHNLDILYGVIALLIFIMAVMALSNPDENKVLFPFIFFFAFVLIPDLSLALSEAVFLKI